MPINLTATCPECDRVFDLTNDADTDEWANGHDCEYVAPIVAPTPDAQFVGVLHNEDPINKFDMKFTSAHLKIELPFEMNAEDAAAWAAGIVARAARPPKPTTAITVEVLETRAGALIVFGGPNPERVITNACAIDIEYHPQTKYPWFLSTRDNNGSDAGLHPTFGHALSAMFNFLTDAGFDDWAGVNLATGETA